MSILNDLVHEAQKKKQQLTQIVGRDVVNPVAHAAGNVSHAIGNTVNAGATAARDTGGAIAATNRVLNTSGEGVRRSIVGTGQGLSGLYDLATPGLGTSRSSKWLNKTAVGIDKKNKNAAFNYLYKPGQAIGDLATFAGGGEVADGAKLLAKGLPGAAKVAKVSNAISKPISRPIINTATKATERYLPGTDTVGRIANSAVHGALHPTNIKANVAFTGMQAGKDAANGHKVTPAEVATNLATGAVVGGAGAGVLRVPVEGAIGVRNGTRAAHDVATHKPFRNVSNDEVAAVKRVAQARAGYGPEVTNIQPNDVQTYRKVQQKLGTKNVNDHSAIDDLIGSRMTYDTKMSQMPGILQGQGGFIGENPHINPEQPKNINNTNNFLNEFTNLRKQYGNDKEFFDKVILENQESPGKIGQFARHIAGRDAKEGTIYNKNYLSEILDDELSPVDVQAQQASQKQASLQDLKQMTRKLERDTGQKGLYTQAAKAMANMTEDEQIAYLSESLTGARDSGAMAAAHINKQFEAKPTSTASTHNVTPQQLPGEAQALQTAQHPGEVLGSPLAQNKTGVVDKQLNDLHGIRKQLLDAETEKVLGDHNAKLPAENLYQKVLSHGGISTKSGDFAELPTSVRRNSGLGIDVVAKEMGYPDEHALYEDLLKYRDRPAPISKAQAKELAQKNLDTGNSEYTSDWQQLHQMIGKRQDELSQYPNGKYRQVKVTNKPPQMSDAEFQSLTQTPEGMQPKTTNKVIERNPKIALRNADAEREVQSILSKGGTTDEALNAYMKSTGTDLQTAVHDVKRVAQESNIGFNGGKNPLEGSVKLPIVQAGDHAQAFLNADFVKQHEQAVGKQALESFNSLSDHDKTLLQNIEKDTVPNVAKQADNPKSFTEAEKNIRTYYDTRHAYDKALGIDVGYRQNYLRQLFTKAEEEAKASLPDQVEVKNGNKNPGYTKARSFDTLHTHVGTALERDINGSSSNHARLAYAKGLEEAYPGKVNTSGQMVRGEEGNYHQLTNRYGDAILAEKSIANKINSRSYVDTENKLLQKYDKANAGLKYVKLGGGAFHAVTEAGNFIGQQLTSGKLFTNPTASGKVLKTFFSPKAMDKANAEFRANGTMDKAALSGLKIMAKDILADADVKLGGKLSKYSGIQALHDATFQREIPYAKLKIFEQKTKGLDVHNPADLAKMRSVADGVNNLFGGINRDIQGIRPKEFKVLQRLVLATDFTEGKVKTAFRAINITDRSPAANLARQAVLGKALLFTALATAGAAASGDYKGKSPKEIALDIGSKIGDPKFSVGDYSVSLPATHVSEFSRPVTPLFKSKGSSGAASTPADRLKGIQKYGTNRLAAIPSEALQLITNKDAGGNRIYGKDYKFNGGEQITPGKSGMNIASGFAPIPVSQAIGVGTGRVNVPAAIANVAGLRVSNDKLYNQDATPVTLNVSDNKVNLPKDQAIKFNAAVATQKTNLDAQLKASDSYKSASPDKQKAMLTTLHKDITGGQQRIFASSNNVPITKKATKAEQDIIDNKLPDISSTSKGKSNTTPISKNIDNTSKDILKQHDAMTTAQYNHLRDTQPDYEYKYLQAKYNNDKANGKLNSATKDIAAQKTLAKAAIGKDYSHEVRDLHNLSTSNLYTYLSTPEKGKDKQKIAADILAYDNALTDAGVQTKGKFHDKNGKVTLVAKNSSGSYTTKKTSSGRSKGSSTGRSTSGSRSGGKGKSLATLISEFKLPNDSIKYQSQGASIARSAGLAKKKSTVS